MRFLADMGVSMRIVEWLRSVGYDAIHLAEQELHKLPDYDVMCKAIAENRILLTMDLDFTRLAASAGIESLLIVVIFRLDDCRPLNVRTRLFAIMETLETLVAHGSAIISVSESKVRIRRLPIL